MEEVRPMEGWPEEPPFQSPFPVRQEAAQYRPGGVLEPYDYDRRPVQIVNHYHQTPVAPVRRGPDPWALVGWTVAAGMLTAVLIALSFAAVALAVAAVAVTASLLVLYAVYRGVRK